MSVSHESKTWKSRNINMKNTKTMLSMSVWLIQCASSGLRNFGKAAASVEEVRAYLERAYCGHLSVETSHLSSLEEREWFADRFEELKKESFSPEERRQLAKIMLESQVGQRRQRRKQYMDTSYHVYILNLLSLRFLSPPVGIWPLSGHQVCYCETLRRRRSREHDGILLRAFPPVGPQRRHRHCHRHAAQRPTQPPDRPAQVPTRG